MKNILVTGGAGYIGSHIVEQLVKKSFRKKVVNLQVKPKIVVPPHIEALELLQQLRDEKLWQNGFEKEYHIRVSDIIRNYIERRFGLTALEQTTDEIMRHTRSIDLIDENLRFKLKQILSLSDMVKFAKELPLPNENEQSMENAILFVNSTVKIEIVNPETNEN
jgi:UDP-glucose 4-epimerase